jgi:nitrogen fixation protein FixH
MKLIGGIIMLMLVIVVIEVIVAVAVIMLVSWAVVKIGQVSWAAYQAQPEVQRRQARARVLGPGEVDVSGF